jgi:hypothetical protein
MGMTNSKSIFTPGAVMTAAPDAIRQAIGEHVKHPHPLADGLSLRQIAYAAGALVRQPQPEEVDLSIVARGMHSSDFSAVLASGYQIATVAAFDAQAADYLAFAAVLEVNNFKPVELPAMDTDLGLEKLAEHGEIKPGIALLAAGNRSVRLTTFARAILVSLETIINDQSRIVAQTFAGAGSSAGRIESRLVAAALENPPALDDDKAVFGVEHGNLIEEILSGPALGAAMAALRTQPTSTGQRANLRAAYIVTSPELEFEARRLIRDAGLDLRVSVLADLPAHRWYLLADPASCPAIAVLRLASSRHPVRVEQRKTPIEIEGTFVQVAADLGACLLRRTGIVRGGAVQVAP